MMDPHVCDRCCTESPLRPFDFCNLCLRVLCPKCMAAGCCNNVPAESGMDFDKREPDDRKSLWAP